MSCKNSVAQGVGWSLGPSAGLGASVQLEAEDVGVDIGDGTLGNAGADAGHRPSSSSAKNPTLRTPKAVGRGQVSHPTKSTRMADKSSAHWNILVCRAAPATRELVPRTCVLGVGGNISPGFMVPERGVRQNPWLE